MRSRHTEFKQYLLPVAVGPSLNRCPRCEPHLRQTTSVRCMPWLSSGRNSTAPGRASSNEGQPVPLSNFALEEKRGVSQTAHAYMPSFVSWTYLPENGCSVPFSRSTWYCSGVSFFLISFSFILTSTRKLTASVQRLVISFGAISRILYAASQASARSLSDNTEHSCDSRNISDDNPRQDRNPQAGEFALRSDSHMHGCH